MKLPLPLTLLPLLCTAVLCMALEPAAPAPAPAPAPVIAPWNAGGAISYDRTHRYMGPSICLAHDTYTLTIELADGASITIGLKDGSVKRHGKITDTEASRAFWECFANYARDTVTLKAPTP